MYLKRLEIQGFKSFAKKTVLEFDRGITAIVGPNGSGKSNVADSLRWVLGEQSAKMLRGKKSDDVIFAGSDKKVKLGFAEVIATFDNADRKIPVDASEVSIGRRVDRSGESEYLINGNKVRLLDIVDLVLKSNIGTSRYTVIGQGTIDQMILAGPPEIKNLLDEASGVKTYYVKREKALRRLEQTAQNLMRAEDLIAEIEPRLKSLRRQAKRMEARAQLELELKVYQREWFSEQYWKLQEAFLSIDEQRGRVAGERQKFEQELLQHRQHLEDQEQGNQDDAQRYQAVRTQVAELQTKKNQLLEHLSLIRGKMESQKTAASGDPQTLRVESHTLGQKIAQISEQQVGFVTDSGVLEQELVGRKQLFADLEKKLQHLYGALSEPAHIDFDSLKHELTSLDESFGRFYETVHGAQTVQDVQINLERFKERFVNFRSTAREVLSDPYSAQHKLKQELQVLLKDKDLLQADIQSLEVRASKLHMQKEFLEKQQKQLEQQKLHVDLELKKIESGSSDDYFDALVAEEKRLGNDIEALTASMLHLEQGVKAFYDAEQTRKSTVAQEEKLYREKQDYLNRIKDQETMFEVEKAKVETQIQSLRQEILASVGDVVMQEIAFRKMEVTQADLAAKIAHVKRQLDLIGGVDDLTLQEYQETESRFGTLSNQVADLRKAVDDLRQVIEELDGHIKVRFNEAFHKINAQFEQYFRMLFNGGRAYLSVVKEEEETEGESGKEKGESENMDESQMRPEERMLEKYERGAMAINGVDIKATPPGKKLATLQALSGGERSLTSIALLCSLLTCFPSPFVVLDEVDAALDDANTIRFGQILGTLAHQTQFITITHNRETMAQANALYGVTMGDEGISKLLSVKFEQAASYAK